MGKKFILPGLALLGGALGFGMRRMQWAVGYDSTTQLFLPGTPVTTGLFVLGGVLALAFLVLLLGVGSREAGVDALRCPSSVYMGLMALSALLFCCSGILGLQEGMNQLTLWRSNPSSHILTYPLALAACSVLAVIAGGATLMLGRSAHTGKEAPFLSILVCFPPLTALVWVFSSHLAHGTDPVLMGYGLPLAAAVFLLLAHYELAAFFPRRPAPRRFAFAALAGIALGVTSLADALPPFQTALTGALVLSALANVWAMLGSAPSSPRTH